MSHTCNGNCKDCGKPKAPVYEFKKDFFDKPIDPLEIEEIKMRALPSVKLHIKYKELKDANYSVKESRNIINQLKAEINEIKDDLETSKKMDWENLKMEGYMEWVEKAEDQLKHNRLLLHLQNLTLLQFKKKEIILSWIYKGNKAEVEKRLTPYKVAMGECFEYYEEHSNKLGLIIQLGDPTTTEGDYMGEKNKDENIRKIGEELQTEANKAENFYKICC